MILGVDFDNTIVDYDAVFRRVAVEQGLCPPAIEPTKIAVRRHLRATGREDAWTELQGCVYGARMGDADAYPGALAFLASVRAAGVPVRIISHRTQYPFLGPRHDLHDAARAWLAQHRVFDTEGVGLARGEVFFETTKEAKLARVASEGCTHFIDDLPEILTHPAFPPSVVRIHFAAGADMTPEGVARLEGWPRAAELPALQQVAW